MNIRHPGNWPRIGRLAVWGTSEQILMDVFECPLCFALTREPMDHAEHHVIHGTDHNPRRRTT